MKKEERIMYYEQVHGTKEKTFQKGIEISEKDADLRTIIPPS